MRKNPGFGARTESMQAAASRTGGKETGTDSPAAGKIVGIGIRMPEALHEELRRISFESRDSINSLLLEGVKLVIAKRTGKK
jgi:hypothetical protein